MRPATEYSDYQIHSYNDLQWICCGGIRSTGLTSSLAIGEYVCDELNQMNNLKHKLDCTGYSSERYFRSLEQLKATFISTTIGLQPHLITNASKSSLKSTGNIQLGKDIETSNLKIDCAGDIYDISHSLLKLAWTTIDSPIINSKL